MCSWIYILKTKKLVVLSFTEKVFTGLTRRLLYLNNIRIIGTKLIKQFLLFTT